MFPASRAIRFEVMIGLNDINANNTTALSLQLVTRRDAVFLDLRFCYRNYQFRMPVSALTPSTECFTDPAGCKA